MLRLEANTQRIGINAYKDAANPIVDGQDGLFQGHHIRTAAAFGIPGVPATLYPTATSLC